MSVLIKITLFGIGDIEGEIIRHLSPLTADAVINKLPFVFRGRYSFGSKDYWTLPGVEVFKGTNPKSITSVKKGDILYNPKTDELIIAIEDIEMPNKVNRIGKINLNLELLLQARNGLNTKISKI